MTTPASRAAAFSPAHGNLRVDAVMSPEDYELLGRESVKKERNEAQGETHAHSSEQLLAQWETHILTTR